MFLGGKTVEVGAEVVGDGLSDAGGVEASFGVDVGAGEVVDLGGVFVDEVIDGGGDEDSVFVEEALFVPGGEGHAAVGFCFEAGVDFAEAGFLLLGGAEVFDFDEVVDNAFESCSSIGGGAGGGL